MIQCKKAKREGSYQGVRQIHCCVYLYFSLLDRLVNAELSDDDHGYTEFLDFDGDTSESDDCCLVTGDEPTNETLTDWIIAYDAKAAKRKRAQYDGLSRTTQWRKAKQNEKAAERKFH